MYERILVALDGSRFSEEVIPYAVALAARGGYVAGQALEGCYDAAAVTLLAAGGVELGTPARLAEQLVARWN